NDHTSRTHGTDAGSPLLAYVHIPKAAGSTVRTVFLNAWPRDTIGNSGNAFRNPDASAGKIQRLIRPRKERQIRILVGHTPYGILRENLPSDARYITILREPVDQALSYLHYLSFPGQASSSQFLPTRDGPRRLPLPPKPTLGE